LRWRICGALLLFVIVMGLPVGCCTIADLPYDGVWESSMAADLAANLPVGSSREQARAWFAAHGMTRFDEDLNEGRARLTGDLLNPSWLNPEAQIVVRITFDEADRVVEAVCTRPEGHGRFDFAY
jgi:hypothetical protein